MSDARAAHIQRLWQKRVGTRGESTWRKREGGAKGGRAFGCTFPPARGGSSSAPGASSARGSNCARVLEGCDRAAIEGMDRGPRPVSRVSSILVVERPGQ